MAGLSDRERIEQAIEASCEKRKLAIPRVYLDIFDKDINTSILLSQLVFWSDKGGRKDGFLYKSIAELTEETALSAYKLNSAKDKLIERGFVSVEIKRANGSPVNHWKLNANKIIDEIHKQTTIKKLISEKLASDYQETDESIAKKLGNPLPRNLDIHYQETDESIAKKLGNPEQRLQQRIQQRIQQRLHTEEERETESNLINFNKLWEAYPNKKAEQRALEAFNALNPDEALLEIMLKAIKKQADNPQWNEEGGRYIPLLSNWLTEKRWKDKVPEHSKRKSSGGRRISYERDYSKDQLSKLFVPIRTTEELEALNAQNIEGEEQ